MGRALKRPTKRVSEDEREIGLRIAYLRRRSNMRQSDLAARLGLTRAQLSTIEAGRVALRFQTGWNVCKLFDIYPGWLDTGHWPLGGELPFPPLDHPWMAWVERMVAANKNTLFSQGWPQVGWLFGPDAPVARPFGEIIPQPHADAGAAGSQAGELTGRARTIAAFERENASREAAKKDDRKLLTEVTPERNMAGMTEIAFLLRRLKRALEGVKKGDLARSLKVPLPRVSEWLSGRVMPSGETTLRLLQWVEQQERQQKQYPGSAQTLPGRKTRRKVVYGKYPTSSHKER